MAHPFQQRSLLVTICKAEVGWEYQQEPALQSGYLTLVAGPFRASTRAVPPARRGTLLNWAPALGAEAFLLTEDCLLVAGCVLGAELWGRRGGGGGRWPGGGGGGAYTLQAQAELALDAAGQALLLSGRCLSVRLPLMQPQQSAGRGRGGGAAAGGSGPAVVGMLAMSMVLRPADAEAAVSPHLPPELAPRLLLDASALLPGAVVRSVAGAAYVDPCAVFLRIRLVSVSGLGRHGTAAAAGAAPSAAGAAGPSGRALRGGGSISGAAGGAGGSAAGEQSATEGLPGQLQALGGKLQAHMDRTMGHVGAFFSRLKESKAARAGASHSAGAGAALGFAYSEASTHGSFADRSTRGPVSPTQSLCGDAGGSVGGGVREAVDHAAAEAVMSLLESNGFSVVDSRRMSNFFWCKVAYEGQYHTSRLIPVSSGSVRWDETFVMAALRPARLAPLEIELYGSNDSRSRGKVVATLAVPLCDVLEHVVAQQQRRQQQAEAQRLEREELEALARGGAGAAAAPAAPSGRRWTPFAASAAPAGTADAAARQGSSGLPIYHPDTWTRGVVTLVARAAGDRPTGQITTSVVGAAPAPPQQPGGRELSIQLEVEVIDVDPRAAAHGTQLLPWAPSASRPAVTDDGRGGASVGGGGAGAGMEPVMTATRQGSGASSVTLEAGVGGGGGDSGPVLSPPWSPVSGTRSPLAVGMHHIHSLGALVSASDPQPPHTNTPEPSTPIHSHPVRTSFAGEGGASPDAAAPPPPPPPLPTLPPPTIPGMSSPAAVAAYACASFTLVIHEVVLDTTDTNTGAGGGGGGQASGPTPSASAASGGQGDYFVAVRCGSVWACSAGLPAVAGGAGGGGGGSGLANGPRVAPRLGLIVPLEKPAALLSLALFRRTDTVQGRKVLNVRAMIGMVAAEQLVGKLRLRPSSLVPGAPPVTLWLPLKAERSGNRASGTVAWCRLTALLSPLPAPGALTAGPAPPPGLVSPGTTVGGLSGLGRLLAAYAAPVTYPPVAMLQAGAVAGAGLSATLPRLDHARAVPAEALLRREKRLLVKWVSEVTPGLSAGVARRLVEDGRTEFNLGRTTQNWRRISRACSGMGPLSASWADVQSWRSPGLTLAVAAGEVAALVWPSRVLALLLVLLALHLMRVRVAMLPRRRGLGQGGQEGQGAQGQEGQVEEEGGGGEEGDWGDGPPAAGSRAALVLGQPPAMEDDLGDEADEAAPAATASAAVSSGPADSEAALEASGGALSPTAAAAASASAATGGALPAAPSPTPSLASTAVPIPAAAPSSTSFGAAWLFGSSPPSSGIAPGVAASLADLPHSASGSGSDWAGRTDPAAAGRRGSQGSLLGPAPHQPGSGAGAGASTLGGGGGGRGGGNVGGGGEVPKDPLAALRQQYDHLVYFMLRVQNVLDTIAGAMERVQALLAWRDPLLTGAFVACLLAGAALLWVCGLRLLLGALLLFDLRPPRFRDPWLPPPANAMAHLPTRADLMM